MIDYLTMDRHGLEKSEDYSGALYIYLWQNVGVESTYLCT